MPNIETHTFNNGVTVIIAGGAMRIEMPKGTDLSHPDFSISHGDYFNAIEFVLTPSLALYEHDEPEWACTRHDKWCRLDYCRERELNK